MSEPHLFTQQLPPPLRVTFAQCVPRAPAHASLALGEGKWQLHTPQGTYSLAAPARLHELLTWVQQKLQPRSHALHEGWAFDVRLRHLTHTTNPTITLTDKEALLLETLLAHPEPAARDALTRDIWGHHQATDSHTLETHIYRLRTKLKGIYTIQSTADGYTLTPES